MKDNGLVWISVFLAVVSWASIAYFQGWYKAIQTPEEWAIAIWATMVLGMLIIIPVTSAFIYGILRIFIKEK